MTTDRRPPEDVHVDYRDIVTLGTHGPVDASMGLELLRAETAHLAQRGDECYERSLELLESDSRGQFCLATVAFREVTRIYPVHKANWHSGERLPLHQAAELGGELTFLALRGHYKAAYQKLREALEMVALQVFFYCVQDCSLARSWGRGESRTPSFRKMVARIVADERCVPIVEAFCLDRSLISVYDRLGAYVHTRGLPTTTMGLTGSNTILFDEPSFQRYCEYFEEVTHVSVLLLAAFFPAAVIPLDAFRKLGHFDPGWLPRNDHVVSIRSVLSPKEISALETNAGRNPWFAEVVRTLDSLPDLSSEEIEQTYQEFQAAIREGPEKTLAVLKHENAKLEVDLHRRRADD